MRTVPERDAGLRKNIGNRHHGRADNSERMFNAVLLQNFYECFLGGHFHFFGSLLSSSAGPDRATFSQNEQTIISINETLCPNFSYLCISVNRISRQSASQACTNAA